MAASSLARLLDDTCNEGQSGRDFQAIGEDLLTVLYRAPRFHYWLRPGTSWFESFADKFFSPDIYIWGEEGDAPPSAFAWAPPHLNDVSSRQELVDRSAALKAVFDGAMYIVRGPDYLPPDLTHLTAEHPEDETFVRGLPDVADVTVEPFSARHTGAKAEQLRNPLQHPVSTMIFLARYDDVTRAILKFTGVQGLSYITLYAYRDWMKSGGWDDARIAIEAGWSKSQLNDFTGTANNPAYLGPFCRHGGTANLPKRPVPLKDADPAMRKALRAFLSERANTLGLAAKWQAIRS
ncbi:MAG: hypothetical protein DI601_02275 [Azospirillum brasilense]|nr:MAG: hypothetical protein DI601_02275 [Azospirillum brasilense]